MTILGCDKEQFKKTIIHFFLFITVVSVAVIVLNVLLAVFRTDSTHIAFLVINIVIDIAVIWFVISVMCLVIAPRRKLIALYERGEKNGVLEKGKVISVSERTICIAGFQCYKVSFETQNGNRELNLIQNSLILTQDEIFKVKTVDGIIISAEESK